MVGDRGLDEAVIAEIERSLQAHELIKIRVSGAERRDREQMLLALCARLDAAPVQHIGKILVVYRPLPEGTAAAKPRRAPRRAARLPKRAYQNR